MFKNPLKYQQGGKTTQADQEQLIQLFQAAAENAQVDAQELVQKASEIGDSEEAAAQFMQGLQLCAQGDPEGIKFIQSLFQQPAYKKGGKLLDFVCKHAKGGYVAGCNCGGGKVAKAEMGDPSLGTPVPRQQKPYGIRGWFWRPKMQMRDDGKGKIAEYVSNGDTTTIVTGPSGEYTRIAKLGQLPRYKALFKDDIFETKLTKPDMIETLNNVHRRSIDKDASGGKIEKAQEGTVLDYYRNKWDNDWNRIKTGWNNFKNSAPGKVWGAFMPNPNSKTGMLGAAIPGAKIKYIPEGVSGTPKAAEWVKKFGAQNSHLTPHGPRVESEIEGAQKINGLRRYLYGKYYNGK